MLECLEVLNPVSEHHHFTIATIGFRNPGVDEANDAVTSR
jgi:hypothetical protein